MANKAVGFIGGGQMAQALALGGVQSNVLSAEQMVFAEPNEQQRDLLAQKFPQAVLVDHGREVLKLCDRVILAVKPHVLVELSGELSTSIRSDQLLVSIAAGIALADLQEMLGTQRVIRVMPNTPAQVCAGAAAISTPDDIPMDDLAWVESLMNAVGSCVQVPDRLMHAVTGVAGSSPAYIYLVIEAMSDGGVAMGLPRSTATQLAAQAVAGAAKMVLETGLHPGALKDQVTSPGGTTIEALRTLEANGVRSAFMEAVVKCAQRSRELAK